MRFRPKKGIFSGTRLMFNYGDAVREPSLTDQFYSLYSFSRTIRPWATDDSAIAHYAPCRADSAHL